MNSNHFSAKDWLDKLNIVSTIDHWQKSIPLTVYYKWDKHGRAYETARTCNGPTLTEYEETRREPLKIKRN